MKNLILTFFLLIISLPDTIGQVTLVSPDVDIEIGDTVVAPIKVVGFEQMTSFQLSVAWDVGSLAYLETNDYSFSNLGFNLTKIEEGKIGALWYDSAGDGISIADSTVLFSIKFVGIGDSQEGATIGFVNEPLDIEFTDTSLVPLPDTLLSFEEGSMMVGDVVSIKPFFIDRSTFKLYQNIPNPFQSTTRIIFDLYRPERVILDVYDVLGKNIHSINTDLSAGTNNFVLPREIFPKAGIYYYTIKTKSDQVSSSVLLLD